MRLKYLNGTEGTDFLFDMPLEHQRDHVARCLGYNPREPEGWPNEMIDRLIELRRQRGEAEFHMAIDRMMSPPR